MAGKRSYISFDALVRMAHILGPSSAAYKALEDCAERSAQGEEVRVFTSGQTLVVEGRSVSDKLRKEVG